MPQLAPHRPSAYEIFNAGIAYIQFEARCNGMVVGLWETGKEDEKKPHF
jgi:hypothetical protein